VGRAGKLCFESQMSERNFLDVKQVWFDSSSGFLNHVHILLNANSSAASMIELLQDPLNMLPPRMSLP
jgi:hypothetical protein